MSDEDIEELSWRRFEAGVLSERIAMIEWARTASVEEKLAIARYLQEREHEH